MVKNDPGQQVQVFFAASMPHEYNISMDIASLEAKIGKKLQQLSLHLAVAESCTGGLISHRLTNVPGSSSYFIGGMAAYANSAKIGVLGVPLETLEKHGAVSGATALAMARGARRIFETELGVSVTGIAGPGGGTEDKPVGLVWVGLSGMHGDTAHRFIFSGDRASIKSQSADAALQLLLQYLEDGFQALS